MRIVIIGSGLAGLITAYMSNPQHNQIFILEKNSKIGGNSAKASSGINFVGPGDSEKKFFDDTMKAGQYKNNPKLVRLLVNNTKMAKHLLESFGIIFDKVLLGAGHSNARTYSIKGSVNIGYKLVKTIEQKLLDVGVSILTNHQVDNIRISNNKVYGVYTNNGFITCDAVVFATGGYGCADHKYKNFPSTNNPTTTGDGIKICNYNNIMVSNLDDIQIHPTSFIDPGDKNNKTKFLLPGAYRGLGSVSMIKEKLDVHVGYIGMH